MPYKNIVYAKLEKRLLNDWRWFTLDEQTQLIYIKLILAAQETYNKIPKDFAILKALFHTNLHTKTIKESIESIEKNFPRFVENENYYYFEDFESKTNYIRDCPSIAQVLPKEGTEKKRKEKSIVEKEKKREYAEFVNMTEVEYNKLIKSYGLEFTIQCINRLDNYKGSSGKKYKSDYRAILSWVVDGVKKGKPNERFTRGAVNVDEIAAEIKKYS